MCYVVVFFYIGGLFFVNFLVFVWCFLILVKIFEKCVVFVVIVNVFGYMGNIMFFYFFLKDEFCYFLVMFMMMVMVVLMVIMVFIIKFVFICENKKLRIILEERGVVYNLYIL